MTFSVTEHKLVLTPFAFTKIILSLFAFSVSLTENKKKIFRSLTEHNSVLTLLCFLALKRVNFLDNSLPHTLSHMKLSFKRHEVVKIFPIMQQPIVSKIMPWKRQVDLG